MDEIAQLSITELSTLTSEEQNQCQQHGFHTFNDIISLSTQKSPLQQQFSTIITKCNEFIEELRDTSDILKVFQPTKPKPIPHSTTTTSTSTISNTNMNTNPIGPISSPSNNITKTDQITPHKTPVVVRPINSLYKRKTTAKTPITTTPISSTTSTTATLSSHSTTTTESKATNTSNTSTHSTTKYKPTTSFSSSSSFSTIPYSLLSSQAPFATTSLFHIPTYLTSFDVTLDGGLPTNTIVEISGQPLLGKTQIGIQSCLSSILPLSITKTIQHIPTIYLYNQIISQQSQESESNLISSHLNTNNNNNHPNRFDSIITPHNLHFTPALCLEISHPIYSQSPQTVSISKLSPSTLTDLSTSFSKYSIFIDCDSGLNYSRFLSTATILLKQFLSDYALIDTYGLYDSILNQYIILKPQQISTQSSNATTSSTQQSTTSPQQLSSLSSSSQGSHFITKYYQYLVYLQNQFNSIILQKFSYQNCQHLLLDINNPNHLNNFKNLFLQSIQSFEWNNYHYAQLDMYYITQNECCCIDRFDFSLLQHDFQHKIASSLNNNENFPTFLTQLIEGGLLTFSNWKQYLKCDTIVSESTPTTSTSSTNNNNELHDQPINCHCHSILPIPYPQFSPRSLVRRCHIIRCKSITELFSTLFQINQSLQRPCDYFSTLFNQFNKGLLHHQEQINKMKPDQSIFKNCQYSMLHLHQNDSHHNIIIQPISIPSLSIISQYPHPDGCINNKTDKLSLLCIDNIAIHFRSLLAKQELYLEAIKIFRFSLNNIIAIDTKINNIGILCLNQTSTLDISRSAPSTPPPSVLLSSQPTTSSSMKQIVPALGDTWGKIVHYRFLCYTGQVSHSNHGYKLHFPHYESITVAPINNILQFSTPSSSTLATMTNNSHFDSILSEFFPQTSFLSTLRSSTFHQSKQFCISRINYHNGKIDLYSHENKVDGSKFKLIYSINTPKLSILSTIGQFNPIKPQKPSHQQLFTMISSISIINHIDLPHFFKTLFSSSSLPNNSDFDPISILTKFDDNINTSHPLLITQSNTLLPNNNTASTQSYTQRQKYNQQQSQQSQQQQQQQQQNVNNSTLVQLSNNTNNNIIEIEDDDYNDKINDDKKMNHSDGSESDLTIVEMSLISPSKPTKMKSNIPKPFFSQLKQSSSNHNNHNDDELDLQIISTSYSTLPQSTSSPPQTHHHQRSKQSQSISKSHSNQLRFSTTSPFQSKIPKQTQMTIDDSDIENHD